LEIVGWVFQAYLRLRAPACFKIELLYEDKEVNRLEQAILAQQAIVDGGDETELDAEDRRQLEILKLRKERMVVPFDSSTRKAVA
jgi:hypothetical protein